MRSSSRIEGDFQIPGRIVANPDHTPFWGNFRVGGHPTGIVGDEDLSASHAR